MKKLLYVVHRYPPFPGGSEYYVRDLAEESLLQGNDVTVFTGEHKGNLNGIKVTSDRNILNEYFDLIIVHGGDVYIQDLVLKNAINIKSPILYLLILPSESEICLNALKEVTYIGCSTKEDWEHVIKHNVKEKSIQISHSINIKSSIGKEGFKKKYNIESEKMFLSSGGFWKHKGMEELLEVFNKTPIKNTTLVLTGYQNMNLMPKSTSKVKTLLLEDKQEVLNAIKESDLYILNSFQEGFGLVLLESMINKTQWIARNIAGARLMSDYGNVYKSSQELMKYLLNFKKDEKICQKAHDYVIENHTTTKTVKQILGVINGSN